jgi:hypothetical protein
MFEAHHVDYTQYSEQLMTVRSSHFFIGRTANSEYLSLRQILLSHEGHAIDPRCNNL